MKPDSGEVHLRFFSTLRRHFQESERTIEIASRRQAREIFMELFESSEAGKKFLPYIRFAVNGEYVSPTTWVKKGDELAFIPPVSGG